jgi:hypothetical protein
MLRMFTFLFTLTLETLLPSPVLSAARVVAGWLWPKLAGRGGAGRWWRGGGGGAGRWWRRGADAKTARGARPRVDSVKRGVDERVDAVKKGVDDMKHKLEDGFEVGPDTACPFQLN